jgi:hypothetical protein
MANSLMRRCAALLLICAGCGGGVEDPFEREHVTGQVTLDGKPVEFGTISFEGEKKEQTSEVALSLTPIRNGSFNTEEGGLGASPGSNAVRVTVYDGDPDSVEKEARRLGSWQGQKEVNGDPLVIEIAASELMK